MMTLTLHEANPGHNMQQSILSFFPRPNFLTYGLQGDMTNGASNFPYYNGFLEGWGLYCEWLGLEMGLLEDPFDRLGYLSAALLRASRLVVDTGIHAFGWSKDNVACSVTNLINLKVKL